VRRLAVAADDVCTIADWAYKCVPRGGFVPAVMAVNYKLSYYRFRISTRKSTSWAAAELTTSFIWRSPINSRTRLSSLAAFARRLRRSQFRKAYV